MKIPLRYVGDDKAVQKRLEVSEGIQYFEPIDAREVLALKNPDYEIVDEARKTIGREFDPRAHVPQLQGADSELQTGNSADKYARHQVVGAVPAGAVPTAERPMSTSMRPLNADEGPGRAQARFQEPEETRGKPSEGMTVDEMRDALKNANVQFPHDARKAELAELVDRHDLRKSQ